MRAYHLAELGSLDALVLRDEPEPSLAAHEVRVRMHAASLNYRDLLLILNQVPPPNGPKPDVIPLSDGAGEVVEAGSAVTGVKPGDRVMAVFNPHWIDGPIHPSYLQGSLGGPGDGVLAETIVLRGNGVVKLPDHLSYEEGAAHGCASVTAWASLVGGRALQAGQTLLVQGTGGVSLFALQYAKAMGAKVIATTSSADKAARLRELGADAVVNYVEHPQWHEQVREITGGRGVDRVVETGGPGTITGSLLSIGIGGHIAVVGFTGGMEGMVSPLMLIGNGASLEGIAVGSRRHFLDSLAVAETAGLHPVLDQIFPFDQARQAYEHLASRRHVGKVIIKIVQ